MGRRKIEIKAIKDDRNRSVTFLKRKGGLFKKAHELSVLCSVNVAVIIFGHNGKLYEFSSGDINDTITRYQRYGHPHEHKGPADFHGKKDFDDEDDEEMGSPPPDVVSEHDHQMYANQLQNQPGYHHMRDYTPSQSPPMANGAFNPRSTPQPHGLPRPDSRTTIRRTSSNLVPQHHPSSQPTPNQNGFAYVPNPPIYNPQVAQNMHMGGQPPHQHQYQYTGPPHQQSQAPVYMEERRQQSMPPTGPPQRPESRPEPSPPQHQVEFEQQQQMHETKPAPPKSKSIFTPIDDSRSLLAQQWGLGAGTTEYQPQERERPIKMEPTNRSQSVDVGAVSRNNGVPPPLATRSARTSTHSQRNPSTSSLGGDKRPRLKVQIPSEQSDAGSATAESSPRGEATGETPARAPGPNESSHSSHSSSVVLPPPSPSASAILSAGAQGPPNPFARPIVPTNSGSGSTANGNSQDTPISALPSRFVDNGLLPSPSSFYPDWGFSSRAGDGNVLPSPLNFQTPVAGTGPSFLRDDDSTGKRKTPEDEGSDGPSSKRVKS